MRFVKNKDRHTLISRFQIEVQFFWPWGSKNLERVGEIPYRNVTRSVLLAGTPKVGYLRYVKQVIIKSYMRVQQRFDDALSV